MPQLPINSALCFQRRNKSENLRLARIADFAVTNARAACLWPPHCKAIHTQIAQQIGSKPIPARPLSSTKTPPQFDQGVNGAFRPAESINGHIRWRTLRNHFTNTFPRQRENRARIRHIHRQRMLAFQRLF